MIIKINRQRRFRENLWVGFGCQSGVSYHLIAAAINQVFLENQLDKKAITGIATIDTKASEPGLVEFCSLCKLPLKTFSAEMLAKVAVPHPSEIIAAKVGTASVAEAAAILAASASDSFVEPRAQLRQTGEAGEEVFDLSNYPANIQHPSEKQPLGVKLLVAKQIFRLPGEPGVVTIAIAHSKVSFIV